MWGLNQPRPLAAIELIHKQPVRWSKKRVISCDGGGGPLGHPRIFINLDKPQVHGCTYCGLPFVCFFFKSPQSLALGWGVAFSLTIFFFKGIRTPQKTSPVSAFDTIPAGAIRGYYRSCGAPRSYERAFCTTVILYIIQFRSGLCREMSNFNNFFQNRKGTNAIHKIIHSS